MKARRLSTLLLALAVASGIATMGRVLASSKPVALPDPVSNVAPAGKGEQVAVFAGGCFWGIEAVFEHVRGVRHASSGYAGGTAATARYSLVGSGMTGHAEAVRVVYDPAKVSYGQLLKVFFSVAHDPTQLNRQGPDSGPQYRSAVFFTDASQRAVASAYIRQLNSAKVFPKTIVTQLVPLEKFYPAEDYHQDYARLHPDQPYIVYNDAPKVAALKSLLPGLYIER